MTMVIYRITNKLNGKQYIGQTKDIAKRWSKHCKGDDVSVISSAIKKYGKDNFSLLILGDYETEEQLNDAEDYFTEFYNTLSPNGYNRVIGGQKNRTWSEDSLKKASDSKLGNKNPRFGIKLTKEQKEKISLANKNKPKSAEHKEKLRLANLGKKASEESKLKMSESARKSFNSGRFKKADKCQF